MPDILMAIKECKPQNGLNKFLAALPVFNKIFDKSCWSELIEGCKEEKINEATIKDLLSRYDPVHKRFKYTFQSK